jgi:hypothetical protein
MTALRNLIIIIIILFAFAVVVLVMNGGQLPDMGDCTWDVTTKSYTCPGD